jgi:nitrogen regulatory protein PII
MDYDVAKYRLIFTIVNRGFGDTVIDAAREKGAKGGTIIYARGTGIHEQETFLNISITPEKEIVMILVAKDKVKEITQAILQDSGLKTPGRGICFVLPVTEALGLRHEL